MEVPWQAGGAGNPSPPPAIQSGITGSVDASRLHPIASPAASFAIIKIANSSSLAVRAVHACYRVIAVKLHRVTATRNARFSKHST
jgi:hypothetical protein